MMQIADAHVDKNLQEVWTLFEEYTVSLGICLDFQDFDAELATLPGSYTLPRDVSSSRYGTGKWLDALT